MSSLNDTFILLLLTGLSFLFSRMLISIFAKYSGSLKLVDIPNVRKSHSGEIPLVGGISIFLAASTTSLFCSSCSFNDWSWLYGLSLVLLLIGVIDDRIHLTSKTRFVVQILVSLGMVYGGGNVLSSFGAIGLQGEMALGIFAVPLTVFATVGVVNSMNMIDGLDGLSGGLAFIAFTFVGVLMFQGGNTAYFSLIVILLAAIFSFLLFNARWFGRKRAAVFLGDSGSTVLGFIFAWMVIDGSQGENAVMTPVTVLWFFALPLFDTVGVMIRRIMKRQSPFKPDHTHLHHIFLRAGFTPCRTVTILHVTAIFLGLVGYLGYKFSVPENVMFFGFLGLFGLYFLAMMRAWKVMRFLHKGQNITIDVKT